uniref:Uncharacterized protein n=1 Tax=Aliarcobacter butzleri TaxID=28197 RepID=A0A220SV21_9BACT|nr:hypothetical protein [Aliarcobacter butzleri]ASK37528.1 Hypothetical protein [Aliarcobacter butzleri]
MREDKIIKRMKNIIRKMRIRSKRPTVKEIIFYKKISLQLRYKKGIFIS